MGTQNERDLIYNPPVGHDGGQEFKAIPGDDTAHVSGLQVWTHTGPGDHEVLKALQITWSNGDDKTFGNPSGPGKTTTIGRSERIKHMSIHAGDWVDSIHYESNKVPSGWKAGGNGGPDNPQTVGNGVLVGFCGRSGSDIDKLGSVFQALDT